MEEVEKWVDNCVRGEMDGRAGGEGRLKWRETEREWAEGMVEAI